MCAPGSAIGSSTGTMKTWDDPGPAATMIEGQAGMDDTPEVPERGPTLGMTQCAGCGGSGVEMRHYGALDGGSAVIPAQCRYCEGARATRADTGPGVPVNRRFVDQIY